MVQIAIHLHSTSNIQFITEFGGLQYFTILSKKGNNNNFQNMYLFLICNIFNKKACSYFPSFVLPVFQFSYQKMEKKVFVLLQKTFISSLLLTFMLHVTLNILECCLYNIDTCWVLFQFSHYFIDFSVTILNLFEIFKVYLNAFVI